MILGVEDLVLDAHRLEDGGGVLLLHRNGADQNGLAFGVVLFDLLGGVAELLHLGAVDHVGVFLADHGLVGGDDNDFELIDLVELGGLVFGCTRHARQFLVHAEVVKEVDGGEVWFSR